MTGLDGLIGHWGYLAIFFAVMFGNAGVPVPEEGVLVAAGYLVWRGQFSLWGVLLVGVLSAVVGDNLGYWFGRRFGRRAVSRYAPWVLGRAQESLQAFVARRGPLAVFVARFVPGVRAMVAPLAGASGLGFGPFLAANVLAAVIYVPLVVSAGYAVGYGFGAQVERLFGAMGEVRNAVLWAAVAVLAAFVAWRVTAALRIRKEG